MLHHLYKVRRLEVRSTSTTEVVIVLLLIVSLLAYGTSDKFKNEIDLQERQIQNLKKEKEQLVIKKLELEIIVRKQKSKISELEEQIEQLINLIQPIAPGERTSLNFAEAKIKDFIKKVAELNEQIDRLKKENERLRNKDTAVASKGSGQGGSDFPRCLLNETPRFIFKVVLSRNGYTIFKSVEWLDDLARYNTIFYGVNGVKGILSTGRMSLKKFKTHARKIYYWGTTQATKCRFRVRMVLGISKDPSFPSGILTELRQAVEDYFYIKISKNG